MAQLRIDLNALVENFKSFGGTAIPVLKGNAYGLGEQVVFDTLKDTGVTLFACSRPEEALRLAGQGADILLLCCEHDPEMLQRLVEKGVIIAVESVEQAKAAAAFGPVRIHIAVDTGFCRFGFHPADIHAMRQLYNIYNVKVEGIFSHFRTTESAQEQFTVFAGVMDAMKGYPLGIRHIAASLNARVDAYKLDAVRIGTGYTGMLSGQKDVVQLVGRIVSIHDHPKGAKLGYTSHKLKKDTTVAMIDVGTGDGAFTFRSAGPRTWLALRKRSVKMGDFRPLVLGHPGMTHTAIDVTGMNCHIGQEVIVDQTPVMVSPMTERVYIR